MPGSLNNGVAPGWPADAHQTSMREKPQTPRRLHTAAQRRVPKAAMGPAGQRLPAPTWAGATRGASGSCPLLLPMLKQVDQLWFGNWGPCGRSKKQDTGV